MTKVKELLFFESTKRIKTYGGKEARINCFFDNPQLGMADINVESGGKETNFPKFASYIPIETMEGDYKDIPCVHSVLFDETPGAIFLVGELSVAYVNLEENTSKIILHLFRDPEAYDPGFKRQKILLAKNGFILIYECGVAYIESKGKIRWHIQLFADDLFDGQDDEALYYWTETDGRFAIRVCDGKRIKLQST